MLGDMVGAIQRVAIDSVGPSRCHWCQPVFAASTIVKSHRGFDPNRSGRNGGRTCVGEDTACNLGHR